MRLLCVCVCGVCVGSVCVCLLQRAGGGWRKGYRDRRRATAKAAKTATPALWRRCVTLPVDGGGRPRRVPCRSQLLRRPAAAGGAALCRRRRRLAAEGSARLRAAAGSGDGDGDGNRNGQGHSQKGFRHGLEHGSRNGKRNGKKRGGAFAK